MPSTVVDVAVVLALVMMLVAAYRHPRGWVEALVGLLAVAVVFGVGAVDVTRASAQVDRLLPVVVFLAAILVVAEMCAVEGLFSAIGTRVARGSRHSAQRMLMLTFVVAALTTTVLSLDATVVLLTPVLAAAAIASGVAMRPMVTACVRLANSASLLLPVSNLTNLLAFPDLHVSFLGFALRTAPVWLAVIGVEYVGHRILFARELREVDTEPVPAAALPLPEVPLVPLVVVALMLVGFAALSPFGVAPAWVAAVAAVVLSARAVFTRLADPAAVLRSAHLSFALFVLCLGVVVVGLAHTFLGRLVHGLVPDSGSLPALLGIAVLATVLANVVNNLPATLLLVPFVAPLGLTAVLAALVGLNVGSGLTWTGSLANLLWRRTLTRHGRSVSTAAFHAVSVPLTIPSVGVAVVVLWAWSGLLGRLL